MPFVIMALITLYVYVAAVGFLIGMYCYVVDMLAKRRGEDNLVEWWFPPFILLFALVWPWTTWKLKKDWTL